MILTLKQIYLLCGSILTKSNHLNQKAESADDK